MRLTRIELENFKGIGTLQEVNLKPITLLFGPNSAGKSTILQSLHYLREILERRNADPDQTIAGGLIDLGGFASLVHNHDLALPIRVKLTIDLSEEQGSERLPLNSGGQLNEADFQDLRLRYLIGGDAELKDYTIVQTVGLSVEVRWSDLIQSPYVAAMTVEMDGEAIATLSSPPQTGRAQLSEINFDHPLLWAVVEPESDTTDTFPMSPLTSEVAYLARGVGLDSGTAGLPDGALRIAVATRLGALPEIDRELGTDLRDPEVKKFELESKTPRVRGLTQLLDELVLGPVRIVRDYLSTMTYIGPLREIPSRGFRPRLSPDETRWAQGLAAWDLLYTDANGKHLEEVNAWLSEEGRLRTGYRLEKTAFKEIPIPSAFHQMFDRGLTEDDIGDLQELYATLKSRTEIALRDFNKGIIVAPRDVGVGISQMIPVIVGCLRDAGGILAIEQPELHVHPAIQVGLGDLFIRAVRTDGRPYTAKSLLIETHSEHIILRLLRRIREASADELPPGITGLKPENLSVIYVEGADDGVSFRPLRVDPDGEFLDRWPKGFFEERARELF